jgi:hypothetical protein
MSMLLLFGLYSAWLPAATACDQAVFQRIPAPVPDSSGHGVATGTAVVDGMNVVGGNFTRFSAWAMGDWQKVLKDAGAQDEWVPDRFGYDKSEYIDPSHMNLSFDIGFMFDAVHIKRQLVAQVQNVDHGDRFDSCWWMIDPTPYMDKIAQWKTDAVWERKMMGRWEVTPKSGGGTMVSYQWWAETGKIPSSIQRYAVGKTIPDLLDAFDEHVGRVR